MTRITLDERRPASMSMSMSMSMSTRAAVRIATGAALTTCARGFTALMPALVMLLAAAPEDATANEAAAGPAVRGQTTKGPSGLPLPRFVSLKAQPVNMRKGPGTQYPATWVMRRVGMPLQIVREYDVWREVIDADGARGWVLGSLLSGRRTAIVAPWDRATVGGGAGALVDLFASPSERARTVARMEAGTSVSVVRCDGRWCRVRLQAFRGHVRQQALWGVYQGETID